MPEMRRMLSGCWSWRMPAVVVVTAMTIGAGCDVAGQQPPADTANTRPIASPASAVTCVATVHERVRMYRLHRPTTLDGRQQAWTLTMTDPGTSANAPVSIALGAAQPVVSGREAHLTYRSGNGGVAVSLASTDGGATLEVYVNYELEVNVDANLSPAVDRLNTDGVLRMPSCTIDAS